MEWLFWGQRVVLLCFASQSTKNNGCQQRIILNNNEDRNNVVKRWLLTLCVGTKAAAAPDKEGRFDLQLSPTSIPSPTTTCPRGFKQPNVAFIACSMPLVQSSSRRSPINATSTEPCCCSVLKTAVPLRKIKLSNGYTLLCCC